MVWLEIWGYILYINRDVNKNNTVYSWIYGGSKMEQREKCTKAIKVNAVVVTYNRLDLLKLCIEKLKEQNYTLNKIIIVNNASTDGTTEYLNKISSSEIFEIINLKENLGGAGGFYYGIKRAYEIECDYIWIMDDDTIATPTSLMKLMDALLVLKGKKVGFLTSNVLYKDNLPCMMNIPNTVYRWNEFIKEGIVEISHTSFVAMLIPSKVVKKVGLPIKEYFIWGDDGEYSTRILLRKGYTGYLVGDSTVYHYMKENVGVDIINSPQERIGRFYYFYRNTTTTYRMRGLVPFCKILLFNGLMILKVIMSKNDHKLLKIWTILRGTVVGIFRKVKIDKV